MLSTSVNPSAWASTTLDKACFQASAPSSCQNLCGLFVFSSSIRLKLFVCFYHDVFNRFFSEVLDVISGSFRYSLHFVGWLDSSENKVCGSRLGPGPNHIPWRADRSSSNSEVVAANCWKVMSLQLPQGPKLCPGPGKISMPITQHVWQKIGKNCRSTFRRTTSSMVRPGTQGFELHINSFI